MLESHQYMFPDRRTHRYWWTWIAAHPPSRDDKWYRILERVFADRTTNCLSKGNWQGFYTEHMKDKPHIKQENHMTVGVFHTFSVLPTFTWAEKLLKECGIPFRSPIRDVTWQYQLQGAGLHADIAVRITDDGGPDAAFAVVFEAKAQGGKLKDKDIDGSYERLPQLAPFRRKHVVLLIHQDDILSVPKRISTITWQAIAKLQLAELAGLELPKSVASTVEGLFQEQLAWYGICPRPLATNVSSRVAITGSLLDSLHPRVAALIRGAEIVCDARRRRPVQVPAAFPEEYSVDDYTRLAKEGRAILKGTSQWEALCW